MMIKSRALKTDHRIGPILLLLIGEEGWRMMQKNANTKQFKLVAVKNVSDVQLKRDYVTFVGS